MKFYDSDNSHANARGDIVTMPYRSFRESDMEVAIPRENMAKITNAKAAFYSTKAMLAVISVACAITASVLNSEVILTAATVVAVLSMMFIFSVSSPMEISSIGANVLRISPKYFSNWHYVERTDVSVWKDEHQKEFLDMLDNEFVRDDFIQLLEAVDNESISPEKSREIYNNMKEVGLADRKIIEKSMDNMLEKYKTHAEIIREIEHV